MASAAIPAKTGDSHTIECKMQNSSSPLAVVACKVASTCDGFGRLPFETYRDSLQLFETLFSLFKRWVGVGGIANPRIPTLHSRLSRASSKSL